MADHAAENLVDIGKLACTARSDFT